MVSEDLPEKTEIQMLYVWYIHHWVIFGVIDGNTYHQYTPNVGIYTINTDPMGTWSIWE